MPEAIAGKYEVLETIGRGGMGTVYKAMQSNLDRVVAVKMLSEELANDHEFRARFQQEALVVARLNHPGIVAVHDIEQHNQTFCIIMEFLEGETLQAKIDRDVTVPEREALSIAAQVARALHYAHDHQIIHRDIKPDNIHVSPTGVAKVMDFGIARFGESKLKTQTGISMGTPKFMSPEQVTGRAIDGQSDLYSLGICLYYALTGRVPFDGDNAIAIATRHLYEQPEPPSHYNTAISPEAERVILKALEKDRARRYLTGTEMAEAIEAVLAARATPLLVSGGGAIYTGATKRLGTGSVPEPGTQARENGYASAIPPLGAIFEESAPSFPGFSVPDASEKASSGTTGSAASRTPSAAGRLAGVPDPEELPLRSSPAGGIPNAARPESAGSGMLGSLGLVALGAALAAAAVIAYFLLSGFWDGAGGHHGSTGTAAYGGGPFVDGTARLPFESLTPKEAFTRLEAEARDLESKGKIEESMAKLQQAMTTYPNDSQVAGAKLNYDRLTARLSLYPRANKYNLAQRREAKAKALTDRSREIAGMQVLAVAYRKGAYDLYLKGYYDSEAKRMASFYGPSMDGQATGTLSLSSAPNLDPGRALAERAAAEAAGRNLQSALDHRMLAVSADPTSATLWMELSNAYRNLNLPDDARVMLLYGADPSLDADPALDPRGAIRQQVEAAKSALGT